MFLSKRWIIIIIAVAGVALMILLIIQFGWIRTSIEVNRRHFADRMMVVSNKICEAYYADKALIKKGITGSVNTVDLFKGNSDTNVFEKAIRHKLDSVLQAEQMPLTSEISGRTGSSCYLMNYVPPELHSSSIDHSAYKLCLCNHKNQVTLDLGLTWFRTKCWWRILPGWSFHL